MSCSDDNESDVPQSIVIDNGSFTIKAGFSGDEEPISEIPTIISAHKKDVNRIYFGKEAQQYTNPHLFSIKHPIQDSTIPSWNDMEKLWHHIFHKQLNINPSERGIIATEIPFTTKFIRETMTQIMFEKFNIVDFYITNPLELALYSTNRITGIVLDSGYYSTRIAPIYEGNVMSHAAYQLDVGGKHITKQIDYSLDQACYLDGYSHRDSRQYLIRDMKHKLCYIALDYNAELKKSETTCDLEQCYEMPDGQVIPLNTERFQSSECLFNPNMMKNDDNNDHVYVEYGDGIHKLMHRAIMKCDKDIRKDLFGNIVLCGGTTLLDNFDVRLKKEIETLSADSMSVNIVRSDDVNSKYSAWYGGSIISSLTAFHENERPITKSEYNECGISIVHRKCSGYIPPMGSEENVNYKNMNEEESKCNGCDKKQEQIEKLKDDKITLELLIQTLEQENKTLLKKNNQLKNENIKLNEECKEMQIRLNEVKQNIKLDTTKFMQWTTDDLITWILTLDDNKYRKYEYKLRKVLKEQELDGSCLPDVEKNDLTQWGLVHFKQRTALFKHIENLVTQNNDEGGGSTAYI